MVDFKPYDTTLAAAGTCAGLWSPHWSRELHGLLGPPGEARESREWDSCLPTVWGM